MPYRTGNHNLSSGTQFCLLPFTYWFVVWNSSEGGLGSIPAFALLVLARWRQTSDLNIGAPVATLLGATGSGMGMVGLVDLIYDILTSVSLSLIRADVRADRKLNSICSPHLFFSQRNCCSAGEKQRGMRERRKRERERGGGGGRETDMTEKTYSVTRPFPCHLLVY